MAKEILVIGLGEIGRPLYELIREHYPVTGVDLKPVEISNECEILHICFPFDFDRFSTECKRYIRIYKPSVAIINSTVAPFTTRRIQDETGCNVVHSPVRGKHLRMKQELLHYTKFIGGTDADSRSKAEVHFRSLGMRTKVLSSPEATEIAKLSETTYFGLLIAWAQEVERYCSQLGAEYAEVVSFYEEIAYLPQVKYTPGFIGGHCVMPNISILREVFDSDLLETIRKSNDLKKIREMQRAPAAPSAECSREASASPGNGRSHDDAQTALTGELRKPV